MEFWDGKERHASQYTKYRTLPGWSSSSHTYPSKIPTAHFPESRSESLGWMGEPSSWLIPGSRTGGTMRDYVNWTETVPSSNFTSENQLYPQEIATYASQERSCDRQRALMERHREKERLVQRGEMTNKWQTCSSTLYRREKEKLSTNSYRELEAWANRYYNSLPRQRHVEAGTTQCIPDTERTLGSTSRLVSAEPNQRPNTSVPYNQEKCTLDNKLRVQLEMWKRQQPPPYIPAKQSLSRKTSSLNSKENVVLSSSFSHPPNYTPPPPYSTPVESDMLLKAGKCPAEPVMEYRVGSRPVTSTFSMRTERSLAPLTEGGQHTDRSSTDRTPRAVTNLDTDKARQQQKLLSTLTESLAVPQQPNQEQGAVAPQLQSSHQFPEKSKLIYSDTTLAKQSKTKIRRGGETVFCLVSRMGELAGLSSSPDEPLKSHSLPLLKVSAPGGPAAVAKQPSVSQEPVQLADEVDSGGLTKQQCESIKLEDAREGHSRESQIQNSDQSSIDTNKEKVRRDIRENMLKQHNEKINFLTSKKEEDPPSVCNKVDENIDPCASSKTAVESLSVPHNQAMVKFPVWKEPKRHYCSNGVSEKKNEPAQDVSKVGQNEQAVDGQPNKAAVSNNAVRDKSRGLVVIDATCVVVKVEFIFPPEKEHVQYVCTRSTDAYEHGSDSLNLQVQNNDHNDTDLSDATEKSALTNQTQELHVKIQEQNNDDLINRSSSDTVVKDTSQMSNNIMPERVSSENETLKERAERILGITLLNSSNEGQTQDELPQTTQTEDGNVVKIHETSLKEPEGSPEAEVDHVEESECHLEGMAMSENAETAVEEVLTIPKEKEAKSLTTNADGILEESEVNLIKTVQPLDIIKQEHESIAEDNKGTLEDNFTTKHSTARVNTAVDATQQQKDSFEDKVNSSPTNEINEMGHLFPTVLDDHVEKTGKSLGQEGHPMEGNPSCETGDANNLCPTFLVDFSEDSSKTIGQEGAFSDVNLSEETDNIQSEFSKNFGQENSPKEGNLSCETDDVNTLCPVLPDNYMKNINELFSQEGSSREGNPSNTMDDVNNLCPPLLENYTDETSEIFDQEDTPILPDKSDKIRNLCTPLLGNYVENTGKLFDQEGTHNEDNLPEEADDIQNVHGSFVGKTNELFNQEESSKEDILSNETEDVSVERPSEPFDKAGAPREGNLSDETDNIDNLCPVFHGNYVDYISQMFCQEGRTSISDETDDMYNLSPSLLQSSVENTSELFDQEDSPLEGTLSTKTDDINNLCLVHSHGNVENTSEPFGKEDAAKESNLSEESENMQNLYPSLLCSYLESTNELFDQEGSQWENTPANETEDVYNLCPVIPHDNVEKNSEASGKDGAPKKGNLLDDTDEIQNVCSSLLHSSMKSTSGSFEQESTPKTGTTSAESDDVNNICPFPPHDNVETSVETSEPFRKEDAPKECNLADETCDTENFCPTFLDNNVGDPGQLFGQEDSYSDTNISDETNDVQNQCPTLLGNSVESTSELFDPESRPRQDMPSNQTSDENNLCSPLFGNNEDNTRELFGQEDISPPIIDLHTKKPTCQPPLESLPFFSESLHHLDKSSLLAPSLAVTCSVSHSELHPELSPPDINQEDISASCGSSTLPSPSLTPVLHAHSRPSDSSCQTSNLHGEVCSPGSFAPPECMKEKQYPKSLRDAVNRIRKHTAPDSENEEEEGVELWEQMENPNAEADTELQPQESVLEVRLANIVDQYDGNITKDVSVTSDVVDSATKENIPSEEEGNLGEVMRTAVLPEERIERKEVSQTEDDALSSSSLDSHDSKDTVIKGEGNEAFLETEEETAPNEEPFDQ